jgi:SAM-dependent methyltransferase
LTKELIDHYGATYSNFETDLYRDIREATFGEDIGQTGWLSTEEQDQFISWLELSPESRVLDIACGSGGPTLRLARRARCKVVGLDLHEDGVAAAESQARHEGLTDRASFQQHDAAQQLPFAEASFDAVICIDAINHLPDRAAVLAEWKRVLKPDGRLLFTDPIVVTGPLTASEIATRSSIGFFLFVPKGTDENLLEDAGLDLLISDDRTQNMAELAGRWHAARSAKSEALMEVEGEETFTGQQAFFRVAEVIARERRLSRFAFVARKTP